MINFYSKDGIVFTTLDLKDDFLHVPIDSVDCKFTAFITLGGHFEFVKLPFWLHTAPAYFQKYIM